jgi:2-(1,2-epoxy-1,2-dihydrophenyl)acetyl-CoA isomerase
MANDPIAFAVANGVARITFDDQQKRNAITARAATEFARCAREAASDPTVRVILVRGVGRFFSPGGDIDEFLGAEDDIAQHLAVLTDGIHAGVRYLARARAPVIVGLNGMAAGGGVGMALSGDYVIACQSARINCAYTRSGLTPDAGTTWFLARRLSHAKAFELAALNETLSAVEAQALGLINRVVPDETFDVAIEDLISRFLAMPDNVLGETKLLLRGALDNSLETHLEQEAKAIIDRVRKPSTIKLLKGFLQR